MMRQARTTLPAGIRLPLLLAAAMLLPACGDQRPDGVPAPAPGMFAFLDDACPDLAGHYRLVDEAGHRIGFPGRQFGSLMQDLPRHHSVWSIESVDAHGVAIRSDAGAADMRRAFTRWRQRQPYQYQAWREAAQVDGAGALAAPGRFLPRTRRYTLPGPMYTCGKGWLVIGGRVEPDTDAPNPWEVRITRAADGGLVGVRRVRVQRSFSVWCGDGCWPNIPLPDGEREIWWHAPPAGPADDAAVDWAALLAGEPPPPTSPDSRAGWRDAAAARPVADAAPAPVAMPPAAAPAAPAPSAAAWQQRLLPLLPAGTRLDPLDCDQHRCRVSGSAAAMEDVAHLLRALQTDGGVPELEIIERQPDARYRFRIMVAAR